MNNNFVLYLHVTPNGKKYFGITGQRPKQRWKRGKGYKGQDFYEAIEEFGWDNIQHIILADDLTRLEARMFEVMSIAIYNTRDPLYGYNDSPGGGIQSEETRQKISESQTGKKNHKSKAVICITTGQCFGSAREAARYCKLKGQGHVNDCCNGKRNFAGKSPDGRPLVWKYVQDIPKPQLTEADKVHLRNILNKYSA